MDKETQRILFSSAKGDHRTPKDFFDLLHREFHFDADVAASNENHLLPVFITEKQNALSMDWYTRNFCNPPYGKGVGVWVEKAAREAYFNENLTVMLLAARVGTKWFHRAIATANEIRFIKGRLTFEGEDNCAPFPSMLVVWYGDVDRSKLLSPYQTEYYWDTWELK
jgi:site-specific DNA-methyltransferase (adenine-specific)